MCARTAVYIVLETYKRAAIVRCSPQKAAESSSACCQVGTSDAVYADIDHPENYMFELSKMYLLDQVPK